MATPLNDDISLHWSGIRAYAPCCEQRVPERVWRTSAGALEHPGCNDQKGSAGRPLDPLAILSGLKSIRPLALMGTLRRSTPAPVSGFAFYMSSPLALTKRILAEEASDRSWLPDHKHVTAP